MKLLSELLKGEKMEFSPRYSKGNIKYLKEKAIKIINDERLDRVFVEKFNSPLLPRVHLYHMFRHHYNSYMGYLLSFNCDSSQNIFFGHIYAFFHVDRYKLDAIFVPSPHEIDSLINVSFINWDKYTEIHLGNPGSVYRTVPCRLDFLF